MNVILFKIRFTLLILVQLVLSLFGISVSFGVTDDRHMVATMSDVGDIADEYARLLVVLVIIVFVVSVVISFGLGMLVGHTIWK